MTTTTTTSHGTTYNQRSTVGHQNTQCGWVHLGHVGALLAPPATRIGPRTHGKSRADEAWNTLDTLTTCQGTFYGAQNADRYVCPSDPGNVGPVIFRTKQDNSVTVKTPGHVKWRKPTRLIRSRCTIQFAVCGQFMVQRSLGQ